MKIAVLALAALLLAGCGLQRQTVRINAPIARTGANGPTIAIGTVTDARQPATKIKLDQAEQASNVGGMGKDGHGIAVQLDNGTVRDAMRRIVSSALQNAGFDVTDSRQAEYRIDVRISKFQVAIPFQFWRTAFYNPRMLADIEAQITITTPSGVQTFDVKGHGYNVYQRVIAENWQIALDKAVADFEKNLQAQAAGPMAMH
jgi:uncharacterized lipoprotein YajG